MFKKMLLPIDGSEFSERAFEVGVELANKLGIPVIITHIIDQSMFESMLTPVPGGPYEMAKPVYDDMQEEAEAFLKGKEELCRQKGVKCDAIVRMGHPVNTILDLVKEMEIGLVVLGSHGRGLVTGIALGSVSYGVVHKAHNISVLVVR